MGNNSQYKSALATWLSKNLKFHCITSSKP